MAMDKSQPPETAEQPSAVSAPQSFTKAQYMKALRKLEGKDAIGRTGDVLGTAGGAVAGASAAGAIAGAAGATTLLGSTSLAGVLGGVFVAATPVGWVIGSAAVAGLAAFGLTQMIRSGSRQDEIRASLAASFRRKITAIDGDEAGRLVQTDPRVQLSLKLSEAVHHGVLTEESAKRILLLVEKNALSVEVALDRVGRLSQRIDT